jgi:hypothetical protein
LATADELVTATTKALIVKRFPFSSPIQLAQKDQAFRKIEPKGGRNFHFANFVRASKRTQSERLPKKR